MQDMIYENGVKAKYVNAWENARCYQNSLILTEQEHVLQRCLRGAISNRHTEKKIHHHIEGFLEIARKDCLDDIEEWMVKYDQLNRW